MPENSFFQESLEQSRIKATIVSDYFWAWAKIIMPSVKQYGSTIAYIDLFSGPGRYIDGTKSTPVMVLERAIQDEDMRTRLITIFNDKDPDNAKSLKATLEQIPDIQYMKNQPTVLNQEVGEEIARVFEQVKLIPTLFFVDPWGYKGLSLRLINSVLQNWGCDCIFFFNYNRINMGLENQAVEEHMNALFGNERADQLRLKLEPLNPHNRELVIVEELAQALKAMGGKYVLPFRFKNAKGQRTSHHLIFVSKDFKGYEVMKGVMARHSSTIEQGVPSFAYDPASTSQPLLFGFRPRPLDELKQALIRDLAGKTLTMREIYVQHSIDTPFIDKNYKEALRQLEAEGRIITDPPANIRRMYKGEVTFADKVMVTFPK
jgi:three-Cys-motif partner protein